MDDVVVLNDKRIGGAWALWETIARGRPELGKPATFADHVDESKWMSFTTTLKNTNCSTWSTTSPATSPARAA
jgi:oleate hydratase